MSDEYIVNSYTTFTTQFSATLIQAEPFLLSDTFEVSIDFVWTSTDIIKANAAFLKMKYFLEECLHYAVFTHPNAPIMISDIENNIAVFPYVPTNDIISMTIHAKLNAIAGEFLEILSVKIGSKYSNPITSYTYADSAYPALPSIKDFTGSERNFYPHPWWFRDSEETIDYVPEEDEDLTKPPEFDSILKQIEQDVVNELQPKRKSGEVIEIQRWKPQVISD